MIVQQSNKTIFTFLVCFLFLSLNVDARRKYDRRSDLAHVPPIASSGWTVPLEGGKTCGEDSTQCISSLPAPPSTSNLEYLAIGRGTVTYTCAGRSGTQAPLYVSENTFLYDAASLIPRFSSEDQFHSYIPRFLEYDYTSLDNTTLNCIGTIQRIDDLTVFTLYRVEAFPVTIEETVNSPENRHFDLPWTHVQDDGAEWDVYRVETAGGGPPYDCGDQIISDEIPAEYVAEYWFYRRETGSKNGDQV